MRPISIFLAAFGLLASSALAIPYASYIRVSPKAVQPGDGADFTYVLNESADSVTIELIPAGGGPAASSVTYNSPAPETVSGEHTVAWDGTDNFSGGSPISEENYRVTITVDNVAPVGWTEFASNRSLGAFGPAAIFETLFEGFSGKDILIHPDPDNDLFGLILPASSFGTPEHMGHVALLTTLATRSGGDGLNDLVLQNPGAFQNNQGVWGSTVDPLSPELIWVVGQNSNEVNVMRAIVDGSIPALLTDADPSDFYIGQFPRSVAIYNNGGTRHALMTGGNAILLESAIDANLDMADAFEVIMSLTDTARYSKDVEIDESGNVYWASRTTDTGTGLNGRLYRWDSATVAAAIADSASNPLTDANASWVVDVSPTSAHVNGVTIDPSGDVYLQVASDGIYLVDNVATASVVRTLGGGDLVVDFTTVGTGWVPSGFGANVASDAVGNLYSVDTSNEQIRAFSPGGTTSTSFPGPLSQTLQVATVTAVGDWSVYE